MLLRAQCCGRHDVGKDDAAAKPLQTNHPACSAHFMPASTAFALQLYSWRRVLPPAAMTHHTVDMHSC